MFMCLDFVFVLYSFSIQFLSMWAYIHTPGIHTNAKLIYADYAMVYKNKQQQQQKQNKNQNMYGQKYVSKATSVHSQQQQQQKKVKKKCLKVQQLQ